MTDTPKLLDGIRVIEFAQNAAVPYCGRLLAGMGADVVKVEPPGGDAMRGTGQLGEHEAPAYAVINPGKRSMALDMQSEGAREVIDALFAWADVALVAFKGSDLKRFGIDWDHARTINPRLIHLTHLPFGPNGEYAMEGGYDVLAQGLSGMGYMMNRSDGGKPTPTRPAVNDFGTGMNSALGVLAALRHRDKTGEGQRVETALLATALGLSTPLISRFESSAAAIEQFRGEEAEIVEGGGGFDEVRSHYEQNYMQGQSAFYLYFRFYVTADGMVSLGGLSRGLQAKFHVATGIEPPASHKASSAEFQATVQEAEAMFATKTTDEWIAIFREVGYPIGKYNRPWEAIDDPQIRANDMVVDLKHPVFGEYSTVNMPVQFSETPVGVTGPSPQFAVHTADVLLEAGLDQARIDALVSDGVVINRTGV